MFQALPPKRGMCIFILGGAAPVMDSSLENPGGRRWPGVQVGKCHVRTVTGTTPAGVRPAPPLLRGNKSRLEAA